MFTQIDHKELIKGKELWRGGFGVVYQGTYRHSDVAIKQLLMTHISKAAAQEFESEAKAMAQLRSPNIVQFYGYCLSPYYCIVMEYMPNGSLFSVLHSEQPLEWPERFRIAVDVAKGLSFLHHEKILHRDIKSLNVLLGEDKQGHVAKLTDFGLSKVKTETKSYLTATKTKSDSVGTLQWMAPELFAPKATYTQKADIYSLGITFWELAARKIPYKEWGDSMLIPSWVEKGYREDIPEDCPAALRSLIAACWEAAPDKRPASDDVVTRLKKVTEGATTAASSLVSGPVYQANLDSGVGSSASSGFNQELQAVELLLKEASLNEKMEDHPDADKAYQNAIKKAKEGKLNDEAFAKVYAAYGEYLIRQNQKEAGEKQFRIAANFGYVRPTAVPAPKPASPVIFSPPPQKAPVPSVPKVSAQDLAKFLKLVAEGKQPQAEAMLKQNKDLSLVPGDVTDLSGRKFQGITGFQYAVWALDWHMWTMIKKHMPDDAIREQIKAMDTGAWVKQHNKSANWQSLVDALQKEIELINASKWTEEVVHWQRQVGGAQRQLPAHVVNEYCHPQRSFEKCPDFTQGAELPRTRKTDEGEWFTATYNGGQLGEKFAVLRGAEKGEAQAWWAVASGVACGIQPGDLASFVADDREACRALLAARTQQHDELVAQYAPELRGTTKLR